MFAFVGMETSGITRRALEARGWEVVSCDILESEDGAANHIVGDVFEVLASLRRRPDAGLFHPTCTVHTLAAAWAFNEPDYERYPGVGYHQKVRPGTLTGKARHEAREIAEAEVERIKRLPFFKVIENPKGTLSTRTSLGRPADITQPYEHGHDASKATCFWAFDKNGNPVEFRLPRDPSKYVPPTLRKNGKAYWANQTDTGQNRLSPGDDRWKDRSRTFPGIADGLAEAITARFHMTSLSDLSHGVFD